MSRTGVGGNRLAVALATGSFVVLSVLVLGQPHRLREPDPYAYRAAMRAMASGNLTLDIEQYKRLDTELLEEGDGWDRPNFSLAAVPFLDGCGPGPLSGVNPPSYPPRPSDGSREGSAAPAGCCPQRVGSFSGPLFGEAPPTGITQWVFLPTGRCASEKNPGYPALAFLFDLLGVVRLAPLFYGALGCLGLWVGARRWLGPWGASLAVGLFCSQPAVLIMAHRAYMPTFTDSALLAGGAGLMMWAVLAVDGPRSRRALAGAAAFFMLALSMTVRYSNLLPALVVVGWALLATLKGRWRLERRIWMAWVGGAVVPVAALVTYNVKVFGKIVATGYEYTAGGNPEWELASVADNLRVMPGRLLAAVPIWPAAVVALGVLAVGVARHRSRARHATVGRGPGHAADSGSPDALETAPSADSWVAPMLATWWASVWGLYAFFGWTHDAVPEGAHFIIATRFYLPAMGAIAMLVAWLLARMPRVSGFMIIAGLFIIGGISFVDAVHRDWMFSNVTTGSVGIVADRGRIGSRVEPSLQSEVLAVLHRVARSLRQGEVLRPLDRHQSTTSDCGSRC
ncbi:MAG: hypothetical protein N2037_02165 [Acidimicrobiales bacterium]|nr:hypothetical protein [Acidimicrobiales bacterium]